MSSFSAIERNYYDTPSTKFEDMFMDYCDEMDLDPQEEDFHAWVEGQIEAEEEARMEAAMEAAMEARFYPDSDY